MKRKNTFIIISFIHKLLMTDKQWMQIALEEAKKGRGITSPNPPVGAILVCNNQIISKGFHLGSGFPHAEVEAIQHLKENLVPPKTTLYVTLEPCSSSQKTPPCTNLIIKSGIIRVVCGVKDPNPLNRGRAEKILREAGISFHCLEDEDCQKLILPFTKSILTGTPWVIAKVAMSLDGRISFPPHFNQKYLSAKKSLNKVQELRLETDAILIGGETLRTDNPKLTLRLPKEKIPPTKKQAWRVVMTEKKSTTFSKDLHLLSDNEKNRTLFFSELSIKEVLKNLKELGVSSVLLESGGKLATSFLESEMIDEIACFLTPFLIGGDSTYFQGSSQKTQKIHSPKYEKLGDDVYLRGYLRNPQEWIAFPSTSRDAS